MSKRIKTSLVDRKNAQKIVERFLPDIQDVLKKPFNQKLETTCWSCWSESLPEAFSNIKIAHVSDLHGRGIEHLLSSIANQHPDLIFCTGDIFDGCQGSEISWQTLDGLSVIAPVYMVCGNHELYRKDWPIIRKTLQNSNIHYLENECVTLERNGQTIEICGIEDPDLNAHWDAQEREAQLDRNMAVLPCKQAFRLTLFHRSDLVEHIRSTRSDIVFSGHIHGGQWRLANKGLIQPSDGNGISFFPKYDAGLFDIYDMLVVVSRGLGDWMVVPRIWNRPEVIFITLKTKK